MGQALTARKAAQQLNLLRIKDWKKAADKHNRFLRSDFSYGELDKPAAYNTGHIAFQIFAVK